MARRVQAKAVGKATKVLPILFVLKWQGSSQQLPTPFFKNISFITVTPIVIQDDVIFNTSGAVNG